MLAAFSGQAAAAEVIDRHVARAGAGGNMAAVETCVPNPGIDAAGNAFNEGSASIIGGDEGGANVGGDNASGKGTEGVSLGAAAEGSGA